MPEINLDDVTVELEKAPPDTFFDKIKAFGRLFWTLPSRIYNTCLLVRHQEFREPASRSVCPMRYLNPFRYLNFSTKLITRPAVMKAVLRHARKDKEGFFWDQDNTLVFFPILKDLYPEETIAEEDLLFTCSKENLRKYRQPILQFVGIQGVEKQAQGLEKIIDEVLEAYTDKEETTLNATKFSLALPVAVVSRLLLGHPGPMALYQQIAEAVDLTNRCMMKRMLKQSKSKEEQENYPKAIAVLRAAIDASLQSEEEGSFVESLKESMTPLQAKLSLYFMYFAGTDTTGGVLNYLLWQLGKNPEIQEEIYQEILASKQDLFTFANESFIIYQVMSETLRLFSPGYIMGRIPRCPLNCIVKDRSGKVIFKEKIGKNEKVLSAPTFAGRDPLLFDDPDTFNPHRFTSRAKNYSWYPFGDGAHSCPGQWLAKAEISLFIAKIVQRYEIHTLAPEKEFKQLGYITLKSSEGVHVRLKPRS
jgi:cytochrome P450